MSRGVVLYGKPGCHLCEDARQVLESEGIGFEEIDITTDPDLASDYELLVPVIELDGRVVFRAGMNPRDLPALVQGD